MSSTIDMLPIIVTKRPQVPCLSCFSNIKAFSLLSKACHSMVAGGMKAEPPFNHYAISVKLSSSDQVNPMPRRSANYKPTLWGFEFLQSIHNDYAGDKYKKRFNDLKREMKKMIVMVEGSEELDQLELIDNLERLGVSYHFKDEIMQILRNIHQNTLLGDTNNSLYSTALKFRLLRTHGFHISQDIFNSFKDEKGKLKQSISGDTKGLLQLYEASFLSTESESTLKDATCFTMTHLNKYLISNHESCDEENVMVELVRYALQLPRHWMMLRMETLWYIGIYERITNFDPLLLELSKLDFNIVQASHQQELRNLSRWWKSTNLAEKYPFSRDRVVEAFFWTVGMLFEPQHTAFRRMLTKVIALLVVIDDIYDIFGNLDELELFTIAVERWEIKAMEQLPDYMKVCYLSLFNTINEIAYDILKDQGINVVPYLTQSWADFCNSYLREARWYYNGYKPSLQEYMENAWISISTPMLLVHAFFYVTNPITKEALESISKYPDIVRHSSIIGRFLDDLVTSSAELKRGDVPKSIQCYMNEKRASEEEAREDIRLFIKEKWELMNKESREELLFSETFIEIAINFARTSHCMYQHGDGHGNQNSHITNRISTLLFEPITIP